MSTEGDDAANDRVEPDGVGLRVVCVDDEPGLAEAVSATLEHVDDGICATATTCPIEALERVENDRTDCVLSDYEMPERDGAWLCERVADHDVPFVLYTSRPEESLDLDDPKLAGVTEVVRKERGMNHYATLAEHVRRAIAVESGL